MRLHNLESLGDENTLSIEGKLVGGGGCCECQSGYYSRELIKKLNSNEKYLGMCWLPEVCFKMIIELSSHADMYTLALLNPPSPDSCPGLLSLLPSQDSDQFTRRHRCMPSLHHRGAPDRLFQSHGCKCICTLNCAVFFFFVRLHLSYYSTCAPSRFIGILHCDKRTHAATVRLPHASLT